MMSEGVGDSAQPPSVGIGDRHNLSCSRGNGSLAHLPRIVDDEEHPDRTAADGFGAEILMLG